MPRRFADLNPLGRGIIIAVALGTLGIAAGAFLLSYGALYAWVQATGLYADSVYADRLERLWPLMLDAAFIIAELAAILGGILRGPRGWPILVMLLTGTLTIVFNVLHAATPAARVAAALPPILMMACFQIDLAIVNWVMSALGRSGSATSSVFLGVPQHGPQMAARTWGSSELGRDGQWGSVPDGGAGGSKKAAIVAMLERRGTEETLALGPDGIADDLAAQGVDVSPRYVRQVMGEHSVTANGKGHR
jgi:Protein of unknown function (DUF2637)